MSSFAKSPTRSMVLRGEKLGDQQSNQGSDWTGRRDLGCHVVRAGAPSAARLHQGVFLRGNWRIFCSAAVEPLALVVANVSTLADDATRFARYMEGASCQQSG